MACVGQLADREWENKDDLCREEFQGKKEDLCLMRLSNSPKRE